MKLATTTSRWGWWANGMRRPRSFVRSQTKQFDSKPHWVLSRSRMPLRQIGWSPRVPTRSACRLGRRLGGPTGEHLAGPPRSSATATRWNGFRGGKGVGCSVGQCLATFPAYFPIDLTVAALTAAGPWRRRALAGTTAASVTWVGAALVWWRRRWPNAWGASPGPGLALAATASSTVIVHRFLAGRQP